MIDRYSPTIAAIAACALQCLIWFYQANEMQQVAECHSAPATINAETMESLGY